MSELILGPPLPGILPTGWSAALVAGATDTLDAAGALDPAAPTSAATGSLLDFLWLALALLAAATAAWRRRFFGWDRWAVALAAAAGGLAAYSLTGAWRLDLLAAGVVLGLSAAAARAAFRGPLGDAVLGAAAGLCVLGSPLGGAIDPRWWALVGGLMAASLAAWRCREARCDMVASLLALAAAAGVAVSLSSAGDGANAAWRPGWLVAGAALAAASAAACRRTGCGLAAHWLGGLAAAGLALGTPLHDRLASPLGGLVAQPTLGGQPALQQPMVWAILFGAVALALMAPPGKRAARIQGAACGIVSLGFWFATAPWRPAVGHAIVFWSLAAVTLVSAAAAISMRNAVYAAIWFALSLVGTAGLFFFQGAQFLGVATIVVYAGAIVVTFLFVVMLAQPEGQAVYDRITWGSGRGGRRLLSAKPASVLTAAVLVAILTFSISSFGETGDRLRNSVAALLAEIERDGQALLADEQLAGVELGRDAATVWTRADVAPETQRQLAERLADRLERPVEVRSLPATRNLQQPTHMAALGAELLTTHLLSVEVAGTLLLAALVGAIAIAIQGKDVSFEQRTPSRRNPGGPP